MCSFVLNPRFHRDIEEAPKTYSSVICALNDVMNAEHHDVIKLKYFPCYWPLVMGIHQSQLDSHNKGQWRETLMFSFVCAWTKGWANNLYVGDLRRHRAHFDVTVMKIRIAGYRNIFTCCNDASGYYKVSFSCNPVSETASDYWQTKTLLWSNKKRKCVAMLFLDDSLMQIWRGLAFSYACICIIKQHLLPRKTDSIGRHN